MAGQAVLLVPHRSETPDESALPADYRGILAIVRAADGPVQVRVVGEELGLRVAVRGKLEPLRAKMTKLADRAATADLGFVGLDDSGPDADPAVITGYKAARTPTLRCWDRPRACGEAGGYHWHLYRGRVTIPASGPLVVLPYTV